MKSKIFVFTTLILVVFLFVITSCDNFLNAKNKTTININLDLSKILKTSRNETTTSITDYILKVFAYNAATYKPKAEIQNLPLLTQTENKVDINGNVKASLDVEIGLNVIFVGKLYEVGAENPIYSGNSEVVKIKATDNKVDLVLKRANTDLEIDIEVHQHTFATDWTSDANGHWYACNCGEKSEFATHTFEWEITQNPTETEKGEKTGTCTVCDYNETVEIEKIPEGFVFVKGETIVGAAYTDNLKGIFIEGRTVTLSDFYMGKYEVTQKEYASVMAGQKVTVEGLEYTLESKPSYCTADSSEYTLFTDEEQEKRPVEGVTWYDAVWYCNTLSAKEGLTPAYDIEVINVEQVDGKTGYYIYNANVTLIHNSNGYRLPTEAEWEYAARGGDQTKPDWNYTFSGADDAEDRYYGDYKNEGLDIVGWYSYNNITGTTGNIDVTSNSSGCGTHQVGKKTANSLGLYDMSGNVREWCYDWYGDITEGTEIDPIGALENDARVVRGGGWGKSSNAWDASVSHRSSVYIYYRGHSLGFRVVRTAPTE